MKKTVLALSLLALTLGLSACVDFSSPTAVVATAYEALMHNDVDTYQRALTGEAFDQYGYGEGKAGLRRDLSGFADIRPAQARKVSSQIVGQGWQAHRETTYTVDIWGKKAATSELLIAYTATVVCSTEFLPDPTNGDDASDSSPQCQITKLL